MKKKRKRNILDLYLGGERDPEKKILPKRFGSFFNKKWLLITLAILVIMLLIGSL